MAQAVRGPEAETALNQRSAAADATVEERIRREVLLQTFVRPPVSHHQMRVFIKDAQSGAQRQIHIHERDSIQVLRYKCDQTVTSLSVACSGGNCKIPHKGAELTQLDALLVDCGAAAGIAPN
jgi:hypothetical protein